MTNSKNEMKERRGKIGFIIALLFFAIMIGGYFLSNPSNSGSADQELLEDFEILDGKMVLNLSQFQSFYGIDDSVVNIFQDTIEYYINNSDLNSLNQAERADIEEYMLLKEMDLLFTPCHFLEIDNQECRIYFSQEDDMKIRESDWLFKNEKEKIHTFCKMKLLKLDDGIYMCDKIMEIDQRL